MPLSSVLSSFPLAEAPRIGRIESVVQGLDLLHALLPGHLVRISSLVELWRQLYQPLGLDRHDVAHVLLLVRAIRA